MEVDTLDSSQASLTPVSSQAPSTPVSTQVLQTISGEREAERQQRWNNGNVIPRDKKKMAVMNAVPTTADQELYLMLKSARSVFY